MCPKEEETLGAAPRKPRRTRSAAAAASLRKADRFFFFFFLVEVEVDDECLIDCIRAFALSFFSHLLRLTCSLRRRRRALSTGMLPIEETLLQRGGLGGVGARDGPAAHLDLMLACRFRLPRKKKMRGKKLFSSSFLHSRFAALFISPSFRFPTRFPSLSERSKSYKCEKSSAVFFFWYKIEQEGSKCCQCCCCCPPPLLPLSPPPPAFSLSAPPPPPSQPPLLAFPVRATALATSCPLLNITSFQYLSSSIESWTSLSASCALRLAGAQ